MSEEKKCKRCYKLEKEIAALRTQQEITIRAFGSNYPKPIVEEARPAIEADPHIFPIVELD